MQLAERQNGGVYDEELSDFHEIRPFTFASLWRRVVAIAVPCCVFVTFVLVCFLANQQRISYAELTENKKLVTTLQGKVRDSFVTVNHELTGINALVFGVCSVTGYSQNDTEPELPAKIPKPLGYGQTVSVCFSQRLPGTAAAFMLYADCAEHKQRGVRYTLTVKGRELKLEVSSCNGTEPIVATDQLREADISCYNVITESPTRIRVQHLEPNMIPGNLTWQSDGKIKVYPELLSTFDISNAFFSLFTYRTC